MNLLSGRVISRNHATVVPMPESITKRVEQLALAQEAFPGLAFGDRDNRILALEYDDAIDEDEDYVPDIDQDEDLRYDEALVDEEIGDLAQLEQDYADALNDGVEQEMDDGLAQGEGNGAEEEMEDLNGQEEEEIEDLNGHDEEEEENENDVLEEAVQAEHEQALLEDFVDQAVVDNNLLEEEIEAEDADEDNMANEGVANEGVANEGVANEGVNFQPEPQALDNEAQQPNFGAGGGGDHVPDQPRYNLRTNRERNYAHRYNNDIYVTSTVAEDLSTPQMGMKLGVKMFGEPGVAAVKKEVRQLHDREVMKAVMKSNLTKEQIRQALGYLMFLKRKRCGKIKGRGCADGRKQRATIAKEDASSPTVATEAVFMTAILDAMERREVAVIDIPGAFMQAIMDPGVYMRITGLMVTLLLEIDEGYRPFVVYERGEPVLYVELLRALYGTLRAARLFWEKLTAVIKSWGYTINPYDACVANKMIEGSQCTITWHIDDLKISHKKKSVVDGVIQQIKETFGQLGEISISRGKRHDYLGMYLDFSEPEKLIVDMRSSIHGMIEEMPREFKGRAQTPAASHLFHVNEDSPKLDKERADYFHSLTMQLMYVAQRGRPDIRVAIAFLSTRVQSPSKDDWRKLSRVMKYLQCTTDLLLRLRCDGSGIIRWWVDASYAVHPNMRGHTGGVMSLGEGAAMSMSAKQKLVARSSTESELIGVHDAMPNMLWCREFLLAQGYAVKETKLLQDNMSAMLLEKHGKASSSKRTKHINIRYFFIKDRVDKKEIQIEHCPTGDMLADFHTKPLQGSLFYKFRDLLFNIPKNDKHHSSGRSVLEQNQEQSQEPRAKSDQRMKNPTDVEEWQDVALSGHKIRRMKETSSAHSL